MKKVMFIVIATISLIFVDKVLGQEKQDRAKSKIVKRNPSSIEILAANHPVRSRKTNSSSRTRKPAPKSLKSGLISNEVISLRKSSGSSSSSSRTPSPRKVRRSPARTSSPITKTKGKQPSNFSWGESNTGAMSRKKPAKHPRKRKN